MKPFIRLLLFVGIISFLFSCGSDEAIERDIQNIVGEDVALNQSKAETSKKDKRGKRKKFLSFIAKKLGFSEQQKAAFEEASGSLKQEMMAFRKIKKSYHKEKQEKFIESLKKILSEENPNSEKLIALLGEDSSKKEQMLKAKDNLMEEKIKVQIAFFEILTSSQKKKIQNWMEKKKVKMSDKKDGEKEFSKKKYGKKIHRGKKGSKRFLKKKLKEIADSLNLNEQQQAYLDDFKKRNKFSKEKRFKKYKKFGMKKIIAFFEKFAEKDKLTESDKKEIIADFKKEFTENSDQRKELKKQKRKQFLDKFFVFYNSLEQEQKTKVINSL